MPDLHLFYVCDFDHIHNLRHIVRVTSNLILILGVLMCLNCTMSFKVTVK